jgi:hypothetical protein
MRGFEAGRSAFLARIIKNNTVALEQELSTRVCPGSWELTLCCGGCDDWRWIEVKLRLLPDIELSEHRKALLRFGLGCYEEVFEGIVVIVTSMTWTNSHPSHVTCFLCVMLSFKKFTHSPITIYRLLCTRRFDAHLHIPHHHRGKHSLCHFIRQHCPRNTIKGRV